MKTICLIEQDAYKSGDQPPQGYLAWHEWADVQYKSGLRQQACGQCGKYFFPQELSKSVMNCKLHDKKGNVVVTPQPICLSCDKNRRQPVCLLTAPAPAPASGGI